MHLARFGPLDGVRGIAVLLVFISHASGRGMYIHPALNFGGLGHIGVYLFFCLSAYFLASKLFDTGVTWETARSFYIKRFFRIIPLYFIVLFFVFFYQTVFHHYDENYLYITGGVKGLLQHMFMYRGDSVFWSVVVEEQFYILVPLWIYLFLKFPKPAITVFSILALINFFLYTSKYLGWPMHVDWIKYITTNDRTSGNYIDIFIFSILCLYFYRYQREFFERNSRIIAIVANTLFVLLLGATVILVSDRFLVFHQPFYNFRYISLLYTLVFSLFIISVKNGNPVNSFLNSYWLRSVGIYGFSIYLLHMPVFEVINLTKLPSYVQFILGIIGVYGICAITYKYIEQPFISYSYWLNDKLKKAKHAQASSY